MKTRKRTRPIFFVCAGNSVNNDLHTKALQASSVEEAINLFDNEFGFKPKDVLGPFHKKQTKVLVNTTTMKLSPIWRSAEYNGWYVKANILKDPENHAFLLFNKRIDGQNLQKPQGTIIVPIHDLRIPNAE